MVMQQVNWEGGEHGLQRDIDEQAGRSSDFLDVALGANVTIPSNAFTTIVLGTVRSDPGAKYDPATGLYTAPVTGRYSIIASVRVADSAAAGVNFGLGVHSGSIDGDWFQWSILPTGVRKSVAYARMAGFNEGDQLRLYAYADTTAVPLINAGLTIISLGA